MRMNIICEKCKRPYRVEHIKILGVIKPLQVANCSCAEKEAERRWQSERQMLSRRYLAELAEGVGELAWRDATFEAFQQFDWNAQALQAAKAFDALKEPRGLMLIGATGTGKSHLCLAALRANVERHTLKPIFVKCPELLLQIHAAWPSERLDIINKFSRCPLLLLDEIGIVRLVGEDDSQKGRSPYESWLYDIMDYRYRHNLPTLITANFDSVGDAARSLGWPIFSRLSDERWMRQVAIPKGEKRDWRIWRKVLNSVLPQRKA